jgi:prepilin-type N-terminal cleavage/methylation domain-containing protein
MRRGFTLIEILVVIGVISVLAGTMITSTSTSRDRTSLLVEEAKLAEVISRAKALAITTYARTSPPCGYGVSIDHDAATYELFAYTAPDCDNIIAIDPSMKSGQESFSLPQNVRFETGDERMEHVLFVPPDPKTLIWRTGEVSPASRGIVYLTGSRPDAPVVAIEIGSGGQISF